MAGDPKYGSTSAGFQDAIARMNAQEEAIAKEERAAKRGQEADRASGRSQRENVGARKVSIDVIQSQVEALNASSAAIERETALLAANTRAWAATTRERVGAGAVAKAAGPVVAAPTTTGRYGATSVGFSDTIAQIDAKLAAAEAAAAASAQRVLQSGQGIDPRLYRQPLPQLPAPSQRLLNPGAPIDLGTGYIGSRERARGVTEIGEQGQRRSFVGGPEGISEARTRSIYGETAALGKYTAVEKEAIAANRAMQVSIAGVAGEQVAANAAFRLAAAEQASASQALTRHGALSSEFIQSFVRGEATLKEFGNALTQTIGKFAGWAVAGGLVYGAFEALKRVYEGAKQTASGVDQLERALPGKVNRKEAEEGFRNAAQNINVPIRAAADAQFFAARAGFSTQKESLKAGEIALEAHKLDEVPIQDATRGLGALHIAFGLNADQINKVFHELNTGQLEFNARLSQSLPQLGRAASAVASAGGNVTEFVAQLVATIGVTGGGGGQGGGTPATLFIREPSNIQKANSQAVLTREGFTAEEGLKDLTAFNRKIGEHIRNLPASSIREGESPEEAKKRVTREIAQAIGGGSAVGNRYGIGLLNAASSGRLDEIEKANRETPSGGRAEDLGKKISQFDEQLVEVGVTFEAIGSEIGRSGITAAAEGFLSVLQLTGHALEIAAKPLLTIGQAIGSIPGPLQTAIAALAVGAGVNRLGKSDVGLRARQAAGELGAGFLDGPDNERFRDARRTTSANLQGSRNAVERAAAANQAAAAAYEDAVNSKAAYARSPENAFRERLVRDRPDSKDASYATKRAGVYDAEILTSREKLTATTARLESARGRQAAFEVDEEVLANKQLSVRQRLVTIAERNAVLARAGIASNEALLAGQGPVGTAYAARGGERPSGVVLPPGDALRAEERAAAVAYASSSAATARAVQEGGLEIKSGFALVTEQLVASGLALKDALTIAMAEIVTGHLPIAGAKQGAAGAAGLFGGAAAGAGVAFSAISKNLLKGFFAAYIGSAIAEIAGSAVPGKAGSLIGSIGGDAAIGAGLGTIIPIIGPAIGAVGGATFGASKAISQAAFGGYTADEEKKILEQRQQEKQRSREHLETPAAQLGFKPGKHPAIEDIFKAEQKPSQEAAARAEKIQVAAAAFGVELEKAFKDESEGAKKALKFIETSVANSAAQLKLYGRSPLGKEAAAGIKADYEKELEQLARHPASTAQAVAAIEKTTAVGVAQTKTDFSKDLKNAQTPAAVQAALDRQRASTNFYKQAIPASLANFQGEYDAAKAGVSTIQGELAKVEAQPQTRGNQGQAAAIRARLKSAEDSVSSWARTLTNFKNAIPGLEAAFAELEGAAGEAYKAKVGLQASGDARKLAEAGPDPAAKARVERGIRQRNEGYGRESFKGKLTPKEQQEKADLHNENVKSATEEAQKGQQERLSEVDRGTARELAQLPAGAPTSAAATIRARGAAAKLAIIKANKDRSFTGAQLSEAETSLDEANKSRTEAVASESSAIASAKGQVAQARDAGNAIAQARDAQATAGELLSLAKTTAERLSAQAQVIAAANQLQQATEASLASIGGLAEAKELNPVEKDKTNLRTLHKQYAAAKGPAEKRGFRKSIIEAEHKLIDDTISDVEGNLSYLQTTGQIGGAQAAERLQALLKKYKGKISKAAERGIKEQIYRDQNESTPDLNVGNIKQPTLYDAKTLTRGARQPVAGAHISFATLHSPAQLTQNNNIYINVAGGPEAGHHIAKHLERHLGTNRAHMRTARLT